MTFFFLLEAFSILNLNKVNNIYYFILTGRERERASERVIERKKDKEKKQTNINNSFKCINLKWVSVCVFVCVSEQRESTYAMDFVNEGKLDEEIKRRQAEWERVRKKDDPVGIVDLRSFLLVFQKILIEILIE